MSNVYNRMKILGIHLYVYIPRTGTTATPTKTTGFWGLITMRRRRINWVLLLIWRYIRRRWLLAAWSITVENRWIFLIRLACAHNLLSRKRKWISYLFHNYFLSIVVSYLTETILLHVFDLTDKTLYEPEKDVGSWKNQHRIGRWRWMSIAATMLCCWCC